MKITSQNKLYFLLFFCLCLDFLFLFVFANTLSISYEEATSFFSQKSLESYLARFGVFIFGQNDLGLRLPFIFLHLINALLLFFYAKSCLKHESDALFAMILFLLLPGVNALALVLSNGEIIIFFVLLLCLYLQDFKKIPYALLFAMVFIDKSFFLVFLALIFYGIAKKDNLLIFASLGFFAFNLYFFGLDIGGHPQGYFLDVNGHLILIFSPLMYLFFLYALYRVFLKEQKPLIWYITCVSLFFILLLSLRQKVDTQSYAPLLVVGVTMMVGLYFSGLRVRLPRFQMRYKAPFIVALIVLLLSFGALFLSKPLFLLYENPSEHFAQKHYFVKELAQKLKAQGILELKTNPKLQTQLRFYGIYYANKPRLMEFEQKDSKKIIIDYYGKILKTYYLK